MTRMRLRQRCHPSAFGTSPFRGGSLIDSFADKRKDSALVPPLKGEEDREAVEGSTMNDTNLPFESHLRIVTNQ